MYLSSSFVDTELAKAHQIKHRAFHKYYSRYKHGDFLTSERDLLNISISRLCEDVFNNADVIISKITNAGTTKLHSFVEPQILFFYDAAHVSEATF